MRDEGGWMREVLTKSKYLEGSSNWNGTGPENRRAQVPCEFESRTLRQTIADCRLRNAYSSTHDQHCPISFSLSWSLKKTLPKNDDKLKLIGSETEQRLQEGQSELCNPQCEIYNQRICSSAETERDYAKVEVARSSRARSTSQGMKDEG